MNEKKLINPNAPADFTPSQNSYETTDRVSPFRMFCYENFPYIEQDFDAVTTYQLLQKVVEYLNKVIKNLNVTENNLGKMGENVAHLYNAYVQLQDYVNNYFENLDIQAEINHKLDEMVADGTLDNILMNYANITKVYNTMADLKADSINMVNNMNCKTLGYYEINDGGSAQYIITNVKSDTEYQEDLGHGLFATLIAKNEINLKQIGCDASNDCSVKLQKIINLYNKINGLNNTYVLNNSIVLKYSTKLKNCNFNVMNKENLINNYLVLVNSKDGKTWEKSYPSKVGYIKNVTIENKTSEIINCIYNASNNDFDNISLVNFDRHFVVSSLYLDSWTIRYLNIYQKMTNDNYAVTLGFLGDQSVVNGIHIHGVADGIKFLELYSGHNGIILNNIIGNGLINIDGSNVTFNNLHCENLNNTTLTINNSICKVENSFFYHTNPTINIKNSNVILENIKFNYRMNKSPLLDDNDIDIFIDEQSNVSINKCFKVFYSDDINEQNLTNAITNKDNIIPNNTKREYSESYINNMKSYEDVKSSEFGYQQLSSKLNWLKESGKYYYKGIKLIDKERRLSIYPEKEFSIDLQQNQNGLFIPIISTGTWRFLRGKSLDNYDEYVDINIVKGGVYDNGYFMQGNKWKPIINENTENIYISKNISYIGNNVKTNTNEIPKTGNWKIGDIICNKNDKIFYCIESGTPGRWKTINLI